MFVHICARMRVLIGIQNSCLENHQSNSISHGEFITVFPLLNLLTLHRHFTFFQLFTFFSYSFIIFSLHHYPFIVSSFSLPCFKRSPNNLLSLISFFYFNTSFLSTAQIFTAVLFSSVSNILFLSPSFPSFSFFCSSSFLSRLSFYFSLFF